VLRLRRRVHIHDNSIKYHFPDQYDEILLDHGSHDHGLVNLDVIYGVVINHASLDHGVIYCD
jgi:hypothetical protein